MPACQCWQLPWLSLAQPDVPSSSMPGNNASCFLPYKAQAFLSFLLLCSQLLMPHHAWYMATCMDWEAAPLMPARHAQSLPPCFLFPSPAAFTHKATAFQAVRPRHEVPHVCPLMAARLPCCLSATALRSWASFSASYACKLHACLLRHRYKAAAKAAMPSSFFLPFPLLFSPPFFMPSTGTMPACLPPSPVSHTCHVGGA